MLSVVEEALRNFLLWIYIIFTVPIMGLLAIITKWKRLATIWCYGLIKILGIKIKIVEGTLPPTGKKYVFLSNHQSQLDIPLLEVLLSEYNIRFLAKKSLFDIPFFGWGIKALGYIPVEREDPKEGLKSLLLCIERLKDNISLVIFPEGTRSKSGELLPFKKAGFLIPIKAKVNVVPIVLWGTVKILPKGALWFKLKEREVRVIVGPVLSVEELTPKEKDNLVIKTREVMEEALKKLKVL